MKLVDIKANFMNELDELKKDIKSLKQQVNCRDKLVGENIQKFYQNLKFHFYKNNCIKNRSLLKNFWIYKRTDFKIIALNRQAKHRIIGYQISII